jgi:hypothetical protein
MMPPTSIDGTDITGATIDGQDVEEITVDGQTVFSATSLPVAYSNLIAWYPFDSATYGGSNTDDVTSLLQPTASGDSTNFALSNDPNSGTYVSSGGVKDVNGGSNSGAFSFNGSNEGFDTGLDTGGNTSTRTVTFWFKIATQSGSIVDTDNGGFDWNIRSRGSDIAMFTGSSRVTAPFSQLGSYEFGAAIWEPGVRSELYINGSSSPLISSGTCSTDTDTETWHIGTAKGTNTFFDGEIDDVRFYNTALSTSQINQIYQNTKP